MNKRNIFKIAGISIIAFLCAILGAYAGAEGTSKNWRRIGIPVILTLIAYLTLNSYFSLILLLLFLPFIIGHGIPCWNDEGSLVGRFWYNLIKKYRPNLPEGLIQEYANYPTRGTKGLLMSIVLSCIPFIKGGDWVIYIISSIGIIASFAIISWRDLGVYKILKKQLLWSDTCNYFIISFLILITILY